jgi:D-3-phosphoglycerate dehydrogenase
MYKVLLTCPPMIGLVDRFQDAFAQAGLEVSVPEFTQVVPEAHLIEIVPEYDGWIIGDDPATRAVFETGKGGTLEGCRQMGGWHG